MENRTLEIFLFIFHFHWVLLGGEDGWMEGGYGK